MKKPKLVEIEWVDSSSYHPYWTGVDEVRSCFKDQGQDTIRTLGYMIEKTKKYVIIAQNLQFNAGWEITKVGGCLVIPTGCINSITDIIS